MFMAAVFTVAINFLKNNSHFDTLNCITIQRDVLSCYIVLGGDALAKKFEGYEPKYVNELVKNYGDMLYRICLCIVCDKDDAEDAVQDTFLKFLTLQKSTKKLL